MMPFLRCSRPVLALLAVPLFVACGYGDHMSHHGGPNDYPQYPEPSPVIEQAAIDPDQTLHVEPGVGADAFVEYESGGTYKVRTSCDFEAAGACYWDIIVTPLDNAPVHSVTPLDLEGDDSVTLGPGNQLRLVARTEGDFDGFSFQTDPGAAVEVDALLDDAPANLFLFWVGDGAIHSGAPTNPVDLVPNPE
jgi:hypothetical protein